MIKEILKDTPIDLLEEDKLGTKIYVDYLEEIIENNKNKNGAETLALVGKWGTGKSSIIESLIEKNKNKKNLRFITYNAWKYNNDSFRKTFLINAETNECGRKKLEKKLYSKTTSIKKKLLKGRVGYVLLAILIIFLLAFAAVKYQGKASEVISMVGTVGLISFGLSVLATSLFADEETITEKIFSPQEFSNEFINIMVKSKKYNIFIIDDIDRCSPKQMLSILEDVYGYLKEKDDSKHFIIIPIDKEKLFKALEEIHNYGYNESESYFQKMFDITVETQPLAHSDMFKVLKEINDSKEFGFDDLSLSLLSDYLVKTPRDVKKAFNDLNFIYSLFEKRISLNYIKSQMNLSVVQECVKLYILKKRWPQAYFEIVDNIRRTSDLDEYLVNIAHHDENQSDGDLKGFVIRTTDISIKQISIFEYLKDEDININETIVSNILQGNLENVKKCNPSELCNLLIHTFKIYILERKLYETYGHGWLNSLFVFLGTASDDEVYQFFSMVSAIKIMNALYENEKSDENDFFIEEMEGFKYLVENELKNESSIMLFKETTKRANAHKSYEILRSALLADNEHQYFNEEQRNAFVLTLSNDLSIDNEESYLSIISSDCQDKTIFDESFEKIFVDKDTKLILGFLCKENLLKKELYESVLAGIQSFAWIKEEYRSWQEEDFKILEKEIDYIYAIVCGQSGIVDLICDEFKSDRINVFFEEYFLNGFSNDNQHVFDTLMSIVCKLDEDNNILNKAFDSTLNTHNLSRTISIIKYNNMKLDVCPSYLLCAFSICGFEESLVDIFVEKSKTIKNSLELFRELIEFAKLKMDTSYSNVCISRQGTFIYENYKQNFMPRLFELKAELAFELFKVMDLNEFKENEKLQERFCNRNKKGKYEINLIEKINSAEDYLFVNEIVERNEKNKKAFHIAFKCALNGIEDITQLVNLHNARGISDDELGLIKAYKLEKFATSSTKEFNRIYWKKEEQNNN